tara:strand:- start:701 stop:1360 length:660 start_codon:yes stop_codon:yes gene_type:complete
MRTEFIPVKWEGDLKPVLEKLDLPKRVGLISNLQFIDHLKELESYLNEKGIETYNGGQVLGCNTTEPLKIDNQVDAYLFLGSGEFHPLEVLEKTKKPVFLVNPETQNITKVTEEDLIKYNKKKKVLLTKFLMEEKIGILVSNKPGQQLLKTANEFKELLKTKDKKPFLFLTNEINNLENFSDIKIWVNTACPRFEQPNVINLVDIEKDLKDYRVRKGYG